MADWQAIKTEYITTNTSYRKLAKKYGLSYNTISERGKSENWVEERDQFRVKTCSETVEAIGKQQVDRAAKVMNVADKLLQKIEDMVEAGEPKHMNAKSIRALTAAVKDLKEIQGIQSKLDSEEQQARIDRLRKEIDKDDSKTGTVTVVLEGALKDYAQ